MNSAIFTFRQTHFDQGSQELTEEYIRLRAYSIYEQRGRQDGHDMEDWLQAEAEILGRTTVTSSEPRAPAPELVKPAA
jgi:hypothetical protein